MLTDGRADLGDVGISGAFCCFLAIICLALAEVPTLGLDLTLRCPFFAAVFLSFFTPPFAWAVVFSSSGAGTLSMSKTALRKSGSFKS